METTYKKATFFFPACLERPDETHEVFEDPDGYWAVRHTQWPMREADRVVTEDGIVIKDYYGKPTQRPNLEAAGPSEVEFLRETLQDIREEINVYLERHIEKLPGEEVRTYVSDGPPDWTILEDIRGVADHALAKVSRRKE